MLIEWAVKAIVFSIIVIIRIEIMEVMMNLLARELQIQFMIIGMLHSIGWIQILCVCSGHLYFQS